MRTDASRQTPLGRRPRTTAGSDLEVASQHFSGSAGSQLTGFDCCFTPENQVGLHLASGPPSEGQQLLANNYHSDHVFLTNYPDDVYNVDYQYWMQTPRTNETNRCDGSSGPICFWFAHKWSQVAGQQAGLHVGPQRGVSVAGDAGANWRMNIDGYINGSHVGGQSSMNLPVGKWVRVRVWKIGSGGGNSEWGVWAQWDNNDRYLGSLTLPGSWLAWSYLAMEVYEADGPCATDFNFVSFAYPLYRSASQGLRSYATGTANYEANCSNTSWSVINASQYYVRDTRQVARTVPQGAQLWP